MSPMNYSYVGVICKTCSAGYPMCLASTDPLQPVLKTSTFKLDCYRCNTVTEEARVTTWDEEEPYSASELSVARTYVYSNNAIVK